MWLETDEEYIAAAKYHGPYSVMKNLIHAASSYIQMQNNIVQLKTMIPILF